MRRVPVVLAVLLAASLARAQASPDLETLRARAADWGFRHLETTDGDQRVETYCPTDVACDESSPEHVVLRFDHGALVFLSARRVRIADGWDVQVILQPALSGSFELVFRRGDEQLVLARELVFEHFDFGVSVPFTAEEAERGYAALVAEALAAYLASPASFRDEALGRTAALRASARAHLASFTTCDDPHAPGRYVEREVATPEGIATGIFDTCTRRMLTVSERAELLAALDAEMDRRDAIVRAHAASFHAAVRALLGLSLAGPLSSTP